MRACWGKSALKLALPASALSWAAKPDLADSQAAPADDAVEASISDSSDGSFGGAQSMSEPYMHLGLRTSMPIGSSVTVGLRVVNNIIIVDQHGNNTARTRGNRHLYDTVLLLTPTEKVSAYVSYDYGQQHSINSGINHRDGIAGAAHWQFARCFAASVRAEWYNDASGFTTGVVQCCTK
jgi:hypothetical protein